MQETSYYKDQSSMKFPNVHLRRIGQIVRNMTPIDGYRAVADVDTGQTFAIVKEGYKLVPHQEVVDNLNEICKSFPEYGEPTREVWLSNYGARMKCRWTFKDVDYEIKPGDTIHPTLESLASFDTSLAQQVLVGGFRLVCTNGMVVGDTFGRYKRKHTEGLNLEYAKQIMADGMRGYSDAVGLWSTYAEREALLPEVFAYESLGFLADERASIESAIKQQGRIIEWNDAEKDKRKVKINAWDMMNILTDVASHQVMDITRQSKLLDGISKAFS